MNEQAQLLVLVPDLDIRLTIETLLAQPERLQIRPTSFRIFTHDRRDPGVRKLGPEFTRQRQREFGYCLLLLDFEGSGSHHPTARELKEELDARMRQVGWDDRGKAIVIDPELEVWVWGRTRELAPAIGFRPKELAS